MAKAIAWSSGQSASTASRATDEIVACAFTYEAATLAIYVAAEATLGLAESKAEAVVEIVVETRRASIGEKGLLASPVVAYASLSLAPCGMVSQTVSQGRHEMDGEIVAVISCPTTRLYAAPAARSETLCPAVAKRPNAISALVISSLEATTASTATIEIGRRGPSNTTSFATFATGPEA